MPWNFVKDTLSLPFSGVPSAYRRARKPFQVSATALGLAGEGLFARGPFRGVEVELGVLARLCLRGSELARHPFTAARVPFDPPFDLNLSVATDDLFRGAQAGDVRRAFALLQRVERFSPPADTSLRVDDEGVSIEHFGVVVSKPFLFGMLSTVVDVHAALEAVRSQVPTRSSEALELLQVAARDHGLSPLRVPLGLSGRIDGHEVQMFHAGMGEDVAIVMLDASFGNLLRLVPNRRAEVFAFLLGDAPISLGNPRFDDEFMLQSSDPARVRQALGEELQRDLVRHSQLGGVLIDGRRLELRRPSQKAVMPLLDLGHEAISLVTRVAAGLKLTSEAVGPYR